MTIDKAIEILEDILRFIEPGDSPDEHDACKMGIAALKQLQQVRTLNLTIILQPLSGETWEDVLAIPVKRSPPRKKV